jgi:hypothetical protein
MIAKLRRKPGIVAGFVRMIGLILAKPAMVPPKPQADPPGAVGLLRPVRLEVDQCCLVSLATVIGVASHDGLLSMNEMRCLGSLMDGMLAGVDRPAQEAIAAGDARGRRLAAEYVTARLFSAAGSSPSSN